MDGRTIYAISKKEFMDNWRNKWVMAVSAIFLILTLVTSYFGSTGTFNSIDTEGVGWRNIDATILVMLIFVMPLVPIIGLMLGYAALVGEREKGSLELMLSYPVERIEILAGKLFGLGAVMAAATFIGFGVAGIIIALNVKGVQWGNYAVFVLASVLLGIVFISISMLFSAIFKKRSAAMGGAVFLWFFFEMIWRDPLISGIMSTGSSWYCAAKLINPVEEYLTLISVSISSLNGLVRCIPSFVNAQFIIAVILSWVAGTFALTWYIFNKKDL
ncbi:MAG: ABC transporter permease [Thermoplasmata archaeon]|nr:MAG: ABC transporter permease [Thermoplasmata archaeon]